MHVKPSRRVAIIGCGGSGKSTVGRRLAASLGVTITHLDAVYYDDQWNKLPQDRFAAIQEELVAADTWVIDGNYAATLPIRLRRATHVIFLDLHAATCLRGTAQRRRRYRGGQHNDGVYDTIDRSFSSNTSGATARKWRQRVRQLLDEHAGNAEVFIVRSRREANHLTAELERTAR